jgi:methyl-accepting chemotaxis protein
MIKTIKELVRYSQEKAKILPQLKERILIQTPGYQADEINMLKNDFTKFNDDFNKILKKIKQDGTDITNDLDKIKKQIKETSTSFENRINGLNASIANLENISIGLTSKDSELKIADTFRSINDSLSNINTDSLFKKRLAISYESNSAEYFLTKYYIQKILSFGSTSDAPGSRQIANFNKDMTNPDIIKAYIDYLASVNKNRKTYLPAWL